MDFVSNGCFELCGYHRHEIESQKILWGDFTHPEDIHEVDRMVRHAANIGEPFEVEYRIIAKDGTEKWVWERGRVVDSTEDGIAILEGFITDITDRKRSETALIRTESYARAVVESAIEAVIAIDCHGKIESFNNAAEKMFGYSFKEVRGIHCRKLMPPQFAKKFDQYFTQKLAISNWNNNEELSGRKRNGNEFPILVSISQLQNDRAEKHVVLIRDLTNQRTAEKEVREQRELLAHVDRLNTMGEMAAGIAHEISQPLTAISMYAKSGLKFLENSSSKSDRLQEALEKLSVQAHRAGAVIERMQQMTRPRESHQEIIDCTTLIRGVHKLAEVEAQLRKFVIVLRMAEYLPKVKCDPIQIQQVVLNLLRNGMESMSYTNSSHNKIILQADLIDQKIKISIVDSGHGISRELAKQLYLPFVSTKELGMGLGLSISRSIISAHSSQLEFVNNKSDGATFFFSLPVAQLQSTA